MALQLESGSVGSRAHFSDHDPTSSEKAIAQIIIIFRNSGISGNTVCQALF